MVGTVDLITLFYLLIFAYCAVGRLYCELCFNFPQNHDYVFSFAILYSRFFRWWVIFLRFPFSNLRFYFWLKLSRSSSVRTYSFVQLIIAIQLVNDYLRTSNNNIPIVLHCTHGYWSLYNARVRLIIFNRCTSAHKYLIRLVIQLICCFLPLFISNDYDGVLSNPTQKVITARIFQSCPLKCQNFYQQFKWLLFIPSLSSLFFNLYKF